MVGHGGSSAGSYLADPTSPIPSHCASIVATSTLRVNIVALCPWIIIYYASIADANFSTYLFPSVATPTVLRGVDMGAT